MTDNHVQHAYMYTVVQWPGKALDLSVQVCGGQLSQLLFFPSVSIASLLHSK